MTNCVSVVLSITLITHTQFQVLHYYQKWSTCERF